MNITCPRCGVALDSRTQDQILSYSCPECDGHAITLPGLRKQSSQGAINMFWRAAQEGRQGSGPGCPTCMNSMTTVSIPSEKLVASGAPGAAADGSPLVLDVCRPCTLVWFDPGEQEQLGSAAAVSAQERSSVERQAAEATANMMIAELKEESTPSLSTRESRLSFAADVSDWVGGILS